MALHWGLLRAEVLDAELALVALLGLSVWLQSCADRGTFRIVLESIFSHLAAEQSRHTQNIILVKVRADPSTTGCKK